MRIAWMAAALAVVAITLPSPAHAAPLGTLTLSATTGSVTQNPMFAGATTPAPCPTGYGTNAAVRVGKAGGPYSNLAPSFSANNYSLAPFTLAPARSMAKALTGNDSGAVADGAYEIVVLCAGETLGDHPDLFTVGITIANGQWQLGGAPAGGNSGSMNITATVAGTPVASPPPGPLPRTGAPIIAYVGLGMLLIGAGAAAVRFFRMQG